MPSCPWLPFCKLTQDQVKMRSEDLRSIFTCLECRCYQVRYGGEGGAGVGVLGLGVEVEKASLGYIP